MNTSMSKYVSPMIMVLALGSGTLLTACASNGPTESVGEVVDDSVITTKIKAKFVEDKTVAAHRISVETFKGTVQLSGFAKSQSEVVQAGRLARSVAGVKAVKNDIQVRSEG